MDIAVSFKTRQGYWEIETPISAEFRGHVIRIPNGFRTDLASVPRIFWCIIGPFELSVIAPVVHDYLYINVGRLHKKQVFTRKDVDQAFRYFMREEGVGCFRRFVAYWAVRFFGWIPWRKYKKNYNKKEN